MRGIKSTFLASTVAVLGACGGGGGGNGGTPPGPPQEDADATGIWQGTMSIEPPSALAGEYDLIGLVYGTEMRFVSLDAGVAYAGVGSIEGSNFAVTSTNYVLNGAEFGTSDITGTMVTGESISAIYIAEGSGQTGTIELAYDPITERGSSLDAISGFWNVSLGGSNVLGLTVTTNEAFTGVDDDCVYGGFIKPLDDSLNIYSVTMEASFCSEEGSTYEGFAFLTDQVDGSEQNNVLMFSVTSETRSLAGRATRPLL